MTSIRKQLLVSLFLALLVSTVVLTVVTYQVAKKEVDELFDSNLAEIANAMELERPVANADEDDPGEERTPPFIDTEDEFVIQRFGKNGKLQYTSHADVHIPLQPKDEMSSIQFERERWQVYRVTGDAGYTQVSQIYNHRERAVDEVVVWILLVQMVFFFLFAAIIWVAVGRSMQPLARVSESIARRGPTALSPIGIENIPTEVQPLALALNSLLKRLKSAMDLQRSFVADAAHELRTPLTAVNLQLTLLERAETLEDRDAATTTLKHGIHRAIHLVQQLLLLARLEPQENEPLYLPVPMLNLVKSCVAQFIPIAEVQGVDLGLQEASDATVDGDGEALRVMLNNLIDNAIRHTPRGGKIDVCLSKHASHLALIVSDSGPGIPEADRDRVLQRFYRGDSESSEGTGLGLSIVQAICERHNATLALGDADGGGLKVTVTFTHI